MVIFLAVTVLAWVMHWPIALLLTACCVFCIGCGYLDPRGRE